MRHGRTTRYRAGDHLGIGDIALDEAQTRIIQRQIAALAHGQVVQHTRTPWPAASKASTRCEPMKPAPPVTRISAMTIITIQQARQTGAPGARLDTEGVKNFLAGQYRMLRLIGRIRTCGMRLRHDILDRLLR